MALVLADRVQETTTTTGTGTVTLAGAVTGYQTFAAIGNGNSTFYTIADQGGSNWEVGIGTYTSSGTTLSRTTVLASSNSGSLVNFTAGTKAVFVTYPAEKSVNLDSSGNVSALGTIASGTWNGSTIGVAYGGTGVTSSSGASSVMLRDANQNVSINRLNQSTTTVTAAAGTTTLTVASTFSWVLTGTGGQTFRLPDATTLTNTTAFEFNNNATGTLTIVDNASGAVGTIAAGGAAAIALLSNATVAGTWDVHAYIPENVQWGTNSLALGSTVISGGTWQGGTIASGYGGTGLTTFSAANNAIYSTSASALAAGTLPVAAGGTGVTASTGANSVMLRDANQNTTVNNIAFGTATTVTAGGTTVLTVASASVQNFTGTSAQNVQLPDATTLILGHLYYINNQSNSNVSIKNNAGTTLYTLSGGAATQLTLITNSTANGTWQQSAFLPNNVNWGTTQLAAASTTAQFSSLTLGTALTVGNGGTGSTSLTANNVILGNGTSALQVVAPGTNGNVLTSNGTTWTSVAATVTSPAGSNTQVQYNNSGSFGASSSFTYTSGTGALRAPEIEASNGIVVNNQTVGTSYSIPSGYSATSAGPVTVASGVTVTVPTGSRWVVL